MEMELIRKITVFLLMARKVKWRNEATGQVQEVYLINKWNPLVFVVFIVMALVSFFIEGFKAIRDVFKVMYIENN